ncbi:MAG: DHH family phosphoesterase, partial [Anaerolineaceae bacterium]
MVDPRPAEWILPEPAQPERELLAAFAGNPVFAEVLHRRGYTHLADAMAFLDETRYTPSDPFDFPDMLPAAQMVLRHIHNGNRIAVCGDYDTDGLTATAILYEGLSALSPRVQFQIPDRGRSAHGISEIAVRELHTLGVELILTCDTGVSEHEALALARSLGMDVIITDHHTQPDPPAPAHHIINPVVLPPDHRMVSLSGAGVAYQFLRGVYRLAGIEERCGDFLDLAAIGLIGDLVPLTGDARWLVQCGVKALQTSRRPGIAEILRCAGIPPEQATEKTISHTLAPRINSLSRMMDAGLVIDLLTTRDAKRAGEMAPLAEQANSSRKQLSDTILMAAAAAVENDRTMLDKP